MAMFLISVAVSNLNINSLVISYLEAVHIQKYAPPFLMIYKKNNTDANAKTAGKPCTIRMDFLTENAP